jgi:4-hydroxybenzoyl-CoA reductase subunit beta
MMPYKSFALHEPTDIDELKSLLKTMDPQTKIMAGGTDIMPNLKNGLYNIDRIISLKRIQELRQVSMNERQINLGSMVSLSDIAHHHHLKKILPALAHASSQIASPQIQNMGTIGGNICLDTRCLYFNQSEFWRNALGYCLKKDGTVCHVVKTGKRCVAAASNDLATVLLAYDAQLDIVAADQNSHCSLRDFYHADGVHNNHLAPGQIVSSVSITLRPKSFGGFYKLRHRDSIDFPLLSVAVYFELDQKCLTSGTLVVNALVAKPKVIDLGNFCGHAYNADTILNIAKMAEQVCHPQSNICDETWRKPMILVAVKRAFLHALMYAE